YVQLNEAYYSPSRLYQLLDNMALYEFQVANAEHDALLRLILRMYGGEALTGFVMISERKLAEQLKKPEQEVRRKLEYLQKLQVLVYAPQHDAPQLVFTSPRLDAANLPLNHKKLAQLRDRAMKQAREMAHYVETTDRCRTQLLLEYFAEVSDKSCRICDYCLAQRKKERV